MRYRAQSDGLSEKEMSRGSGPGKLLGRRAAISVYDRDSLSDGLTGLITRVFESSSPVKVGEGTYAQSIVINIRLDEPLGKIDEYWTFAVPVRDVELVIWDRQELGRLISSGGTSHSACSVFAFKEGSDTGAEAVEIFGQMEGIAKEADLKLSSR